MRVNIEPREEADLGDQDQCCWQVVNLVARWRHLHCTEVSLWPRGGRIGFRLRGFVKLINYNKTGNKNSTRVIAVGKVIVATA